jgi:hypothetical protein
MKYLLIDFGASFVKSASFDDSDNKIRNYAEIQSPFLDADSLQLSNLKNILDSILSAYSDCGYVITSSIKNGTYNNDVYESWKIKIAENDVCDLISKIFEDQQTYHVHNDHNKSSKIKNLNKLGTYREKIFLSCLGDTDCVLRSKHLSPGEFIVNMGTGSQIISCDEILSFIPSGRMLNVFYNFFNSLNLNIFNYINNLTVNDLLISDLKFDLSVFPQAVNFIDFGKILNINEHNFNIHNFLTSLVRNFLDQYIDYLSNKNFSKVYLTGGIAQKVPVVLDYFRYKFPEKEIAIDTNCNVHLGMVEMITNEKNFNNWI